MASLEERNATYGEVFDTACEVIAAIEANPDENPEENGSATNRMAALLAKLSAQGYDIFDMQDLAMRAGEDYRDRSRELDALG